MPNILSEIPNAIIALAEEKNDIASVHFVGIYLRNNWISLLPINFPIL